MSAGQQAIALVTGANTGIGLETARGLAERGMSVVMTARSRAKGEAAVADVRRSTGSDAVSLLDLDLASTASIRASAESFLAQHSRLDLLINNAGLMLDERRVTEDGFEMTFGVNHLGHFLLTALLLDCLKATAPARVVNLASAAHTASRGLDFDDLMRERRSYSTMGAYGDSKLANILFTRSLAKRLAGTGVTTFAVHPGVVHTSFAQDGDTNALFTFFYKIAGPFMRTPAQGAATSLHCATADVTGETGGYFANCKQKTPSKAALDDGAAERLWSVSESLLGL